MYPTQNPYFSGVQQNNMLPPMQILEANGKTSINALKMAPNSSALIADTTEPIIWKCVSDSLGNVTATAWDISPHKSEEEIKQENVNAAILDMNARLKRLEERYEQPNSNWNYQEQPIDTKYRSDKRNVGNAERSRKPSSNVESNNAE